MGRGAGPQRSAFLSAFFALVGCHGLARHGRSAVAADHDGAGLRKGISRRHPAPHPVLRIVLGTRLDIVWVALFSLVYLVGVGTIMNVTATSQTRRVRRCRARRRRRPTTMRRAAFVVLPDRLRARGGAHRVSFYIARGSPVWQPSIPIALTVLAIAQMGVHLVFFLHLTSGPRQRQQCARTRVRPRHRHAARVRSLWIMTHSERADDADGRGHEDAALSLVGECALRVGQARLECVTVNAMTSSRSARSEAILVIDSGRYGSRGREDQALELESIAVARDRQTVRRHSKPAGRQEPVDLFGARSDVGPESKRRGNGGVGRAACARSAGINASAGHEQRSEAPAPAGRNERPPGMPMADEPQREAAVVRPRTFSPLLTMMPAPRNPMPVRMLPMTRVGSPVPAPWTAASVPLTGIAGHQRHGA